MKNTLKNIVRAKEFTLIVVLALIVVGATAINPNYISGDNIRNIFNAAFSTGAIAIGMACLLIGGQMDLSASATGAMAGIFVSMLIQAGWAWPLAVVVALIFGAATGLFNAFLVNKLHFTSFISTLGVSTVYAGLALVITNGGNIPIGNEQFWQLGSYNVLGMFPFPFFVLMILMVVYGVVLAKTRAGRRIYMCGGNAVASRLAGINPKKVTTLLFVNNSMIAALAGVFITARMHMGSPTALTGEDLNAITAAVLGGVAFTGGGGTMFGVFCGVMLSTAFQNALVVVGLDSYYRILAKGLLLIAALALDFYREKNRIKSLKQH